MLIVYFVVCTSASDCLLRIIPKMTYWMFSGTQVWIPFLSGVSLRWSILRLVTVCSQVNHLGIWSTSDVDSVFHLFRTSKVSTDLPGWGKGRACLVTGNPIWQVMLHSFEMGSYEEPCTSSILVLLLGTTGLCVSSWHNSRHVVWCYLCLDATFRS